VDIAVWLEDPCEALHYVIYFSAELEAEVKLPADVQVLNEAPSPPVHVVTRGRLPISRDEKIEEEARQRHNPGVLRLRVLLLNVIKC